MDSIHTDNQDSLPCFTINQIAYAPLDTVDYDVTSTGNADTDSVDLNQFAFALTPLTHGNF